MTHFVRDPGFSGGISTTLTGYVIRILESNKAGVKTQTEFLSLPYLKSLIEIYGLERVEKIVHDHWEKLGENSKL